MTDDEQTPALRLTIGTPLTIHTVGNARGTPLTAQVLGMLEGASIIAHLLGGGKLQLGSRLSVRCLEGKSIFGFTSTVIEMCSSPYPHFHLSYPSELDRIEVRQSERVPVAIPVTVHNAAGGSVDAEVRDLSASGALLIGPAATGNPGERVEFELPLVSGPMTRTLSVKASVRNAAALSQTPGSAPRYRSGLQFVELSAEDRLFLLGFVYERLAASRARFSR